MSVQPSSKIKYRQIKESGFLSYTLLVVVYAVDRLKNCTQSEAHEFLYERGMIEVRGKQSITPRFAQLVYRKALVEVLPLRQCKINASSTHVKNYKMSGEMPTPRIPTPKPVFFFAIKAPGQRGKIWSSEKKALIKFSKCTDGEKFLKLRQVIK